jgi:transcriptional regulator
MALYIPKHFSVTDEDAIRAFIRSNAFGLVISVDEGEPLASHLPFVFDPDDRGVLLAHFAKGNKQYEHLDGNRVLLVFQGPHAYISPIWYEQQPSVPTWNYTAVHVRGRVRVMHDDSTAAARVVDLLSKENDRYGWKMDSLTASYTSAMLRGIVAIAVDIDRFDAKAKMSQNRSDGDRVGIVRHLRAQGDEHSTETARLVENPALFGVSSASREL